MIKVLITGKMRSGKSYATQALLEWARENGYKPLRVSLGFWVKRLLKRGFHREDREGMQTLGTEVMRTCAGKLFGHELFWVNLMFADMHDEEANGHNFFVCDDGRFPNEVDEFRKRGFIIVRLRTTRELQLSRDQEGKKGTTGLDHPSETSLDVFEGTEYFDLETSPEMTVKQITNKIIEFILNER